MAQVGVLFENQDGSFQGQLKTLTLSLNFYLFANHDGGEHHFNVMAGDNIKIGRAWAKTIMNGDQRGQTYYSIQMDDMSFPMTINVAAFPARQGRDNEFELQWNRPKEGNGNNQNQKGGFGQGNGSAGSASSPAFGQSFDDVPPANGPEDYGRSA